MEFEAKKMLFLINGLGMGNSTRCDSIIQNLIQKGYKIDVLTSGNGIQYFSKTNYISQLLGIRPLYYGSTKGKLSIWKTILAIPDFFKIMKTNVLFLRKLLDTRKYSGLVIDSDYSIFFLKKNIQVPIFSLNNASVVIEECRKLDLIPKNIRMQLLIEKCDKWFHDKIPDHNLCPTILYDKTNDKSKNNFPPFVRKNLKLRSPQTKLRKILIMLSGSQFGASTSFLKSLKYRKGIQVDVVGREGNNYGWIKFHGKVFNNKDLLNEADMMVVNGGFSAVSEAVVLRKPVIVIPVENHAEQFINALLVEKAGLGLSATIENVTFKMEVMMDRFAEFVNSHQKFECASNGSYLAAEYINKILNK